MSVTINPIMHGLHKMVLPVEVLGYTSIYFTEYSILKAPPHAIITFYREGMKVAEFINSADILRGIVDNLRGQSELVEIKL